MDTNPENPMHTVKKDYIDNSGQTLENGRLNIKAFNFSLYDNTFLDPEYIESIEKATPSGMFFERDVLGKWVSAQGVVYPDFDEKKHIAKKIKGDIKRYFAGLDFGYEHHGALLVIAETTTGDYYLVEEIAEQHKFIEWWDDRLKELSAKYKRLPVWADHARPDYIKYLKSKGHDVRNANKAVIEGISHTGGLLKQNRLFFLEDKFKKGREEIYQYCWKGGEGKEDVVKVHDDVMDALRYALYSQTTKSQARAKINPF
jgi:PBSX family phage terminase large subunit